MEIRSARRSERRRAAALVSLVSLGSLGAPAHALAQTPGDAGPSTWSFPDEEPPAKPPAELPPPSRSQEAPANLPPPEPVVPPPPAELPPVRRAPAAPPPGPSFPVTVSTGATSVSIRGPGIDEPLRCSGTCTFRLWEEVYWVDVQNSGRVWTSSVTVTEAKHVVIEAPSPGARGLGIATIVVGGSIISVAGFYLYVTELNCGSGGPYSGTASCRSAEKAVPYWLGAIGAGALVSGLGIGLYISNSKPSIEVLPVIGKHARRAPDTFVSLAPVDGSTLPSLSLRTSF